MIARRCPVILAAWLALLPLTGCGGQPVEPADRRASPVRPRLELKTESPTLHLLNGQQLRTAVVVTWPEDGTPAAVTGTVEVDPPGGGVKARLDPPQAVPDRPREVTLPLTLLVLETARSGQHIVTLSVRDDNGASAETRITVEVPPKY